MTELIHQLTQQTYYQLNQLTNSLHDRSGLERRALIVLFLNQTRIKFAKLMVAVKWALNNSYAPANGREEESNKDGTAGNFIINKSWDILRVIEAQDSLLRNAADSLYNLHSEVSERSAPIYDLTNAVDVLTTGAYKRLPLVIHKTIESPTITTPRDDEKKRVIDRLSRIIHLKLFSASIPSQFTEAYVLNGHAVCGVSREFRAHITLKGDTETEPWVISHLDIFVRSDPELTEESPNLQHPSFSKQIKEVNHLAQSRMSASSNPLHDLYEVVHAFCISLQLYILSHQCQKLSKIQPSLQLVSDGSDHSKKIVIKYWTSSSVTASNTPATSSQSGETSKSPPTLEISSSPSGLTLKHTPSITDPSNHSVPLMKPRSDRLNLGEILNHVINAYVQSRLTRAYESLRPTSGGFDFHSRSRLLPSEEDAHQLCLKIDLVKNSSLNVRIDRRTGLYSLKVEPPSFEEDFIKLLEDRINSMDVGEIKTVVRVSLNRKMVEYYESLAHSARLTTTRRLPKRSLVANANFTENALYIRLAQPHQDYFLVVEITEIFQQKLFLIRTKPNDEVTGLVNIEQVEALPDRHNGSIELKPLPIAACYRILNRMRE
ncbi:hypothetical protein PROFUN_01595 [Planoprotostelium fungivorum]|uniref:Mediator of RNA polymerase II transcription subunit 14 n=1 Tax=Planoprotostelium fungivorum TaxID=1890364 RepID=A0A2P6NTN2_9EUKA|nr:hypothetical protein PROFUN_01595 [Planoprotostelium fungivorum]